MLEITSAVALKKPSWRTKPGLGAGAGARGVSDRLANPHLNVQGSGVGESGVREEHGIGCGCGVSVCRLLGQDALPQTTESLSGP